MNNTKFEYFLALRRLVDAAEQLSEEDFSKLSKESYNIEIHLTRKRNKQESVSSAQEIDFALIIEKLTNFNSREEAQQFLKSNFSTRKSTEQIARKLDIPISKQDRVETLRDKVIESTVGARIRSLAIRGQQVEQITTEDTR